MSDLRSDSWRRRLGPEQIAAMLATVIVLGGLGVVSTRGASEGAIPRPSAPRASVVPAATVHPFATNATLARNLLLRLADDQSTLAKELSRSGFDAGAVVAAVRQVNITASTGSDFSDPLVKVPGSRAVGEALMEFYGSVRAAAEATLAISAGAEVASRAAAERLLAAMEPRAALQEQVEALIASARQTPSPAIAPSAAPSAATASAPPSQPTATTAPTATPVPRTPPPSGTPGPTSTASVPGLSGQLENPGFEATDATPWTLVVEAPWTATLTIDASAEAYEGERSARIEIPAAPGARTAISLRQGGIKIAQNRRYICRLALRAATNRDVRVRVASVSGATYGTRLVAVGPAWGVVEFEFGAFVEDPAAVVEIDFGRSAVTGWVDAVQITDASFP